MGKIPILGLCGVLAAGCANAAPEGETTELSQSLQRTELRELRRTVRLLNAVGSEQTGITYSLLPPPIGEIPPPIPDIPPPVPNLPPPVNDRPAPILALESEPVDGLERRYRLPSTESRLGVDIFDYPPGPTYPPGPSIVARTAAGAPPLVAVSQPPPIGETPPPTGDTPPPIGDLPPPIGDRVAFQVNGTNLRVVGSATLAGSELTFDVFDAAGRLVAHFGGQ